MRKFFVLVACAFSISTYAQLPVFNSADQSAAPDYTNEANWSALPFRLDAADLTPGTEQWINDSLKDVDVFYIYPTIYVKGKMWNADLKDRKLNKRIDEKPVKYQASVFNESCRVYAPRYRQSILKAFSTLKTSDGKPGDGYRSLDFAYQDVKAAFEYYLKHYNNGRPIIIAGHSQGTYHARRLLQEYFDSTNLRNRLVAAYTIGYGITRNMYTTLKPCDNPNQTGCYVTYASFKQGYDPGTSILYGDVTVNPVTWTTDTAAIVCTNTLGGLLLDTKKGPQKLCDVQIHNNYLWVKVNYPVVRNWDNLHIADYNLFWYDIRKNVKDRISAFWKK